MPIKRLPGVYYQENVTYELSGEGSKIPVFMGITGNTDVFNFKCYDTIAKATELGSGTFIRTGKILDGYIEIKIPTSTIVNMVGKTFYIDKNVQPNTETVYELKTDNEGTIVTAEKFITITSNTEVNRTYDGTTILKYSSYKEVNTPVKDGGLGQEDATGEVPSGNYLMKAIKEFYEESKLRTSADVGVPHIYVIDIGLGDDYTAWTNALMKSKSLIDCQVEVPIGGVMKEFTKIVTIDNVTTTSVIREPVLCKRNKDLIGVKVNGAYKKLKISGETGNIKTTNEQGQEVDLDTSNSYIDDEGVPLDYYVTIPQFMATIYNGQNSDGEYGLIESARELDLRYSFITVRDATDEELKGITSKFNESRVGLCEPLLFGKTISRICCTPNNTEPGYYPYRSVSEGTFVPRTKKEMKDLQDNGIIFNRDEYINGQIYPKINLCVATSFVDNPRPADALFHARFNADNLLREIFQASYEFVKANETGTNIAYLQTKINKLVNDKVIAEEMVRWDDKTEEGTRLRVAQSKEDPYAIEISGQLQPVKCTIAIDVTAELRI